MDDATGVNNANVGQSLSAPAGTLTRKELSQKLRRLAMSYLGEVPEACETIAAKSPSLDQRLLALQIRVNSADSVISIAADPDPQVALLNMVTVLTLQRMLAEERGESFFAEQAPLYVAAAQRMEDEVWKLAAQAMDEQEQAQLKELIVQYRKDHPNEVYVWWVRFSEFSAYKEQFSVASIGQGIVDVFVPVGGAVAGIESTTDVAERATWLAARQALILQWRVELTYLQTLSAPETARLLGDVERISATVDALPGRIAEERKAILEAFDMQQGQLREVISDARAAVGEINQTVADSKEVVTEVDRAIQSAGQTVGQVESAISQAERSIASAKAILPETESALAQLQLTSDSLNQTLTTLDTFTRQFDAEEDPDALPGRPFDITEYTQAAEQAGKTAAELNTLINSIDKTAEPTRLDATLDTIEGRLSAVIWQAGLVFLAVGLILILAAKLLPRRRSA